MKFDLRYQKLDAAHAFLSPSKYHWLNYDVEKLIRTYKNHRSAARGSELHDLASRMITLRVFLPRTKSALNAFVNDSIGFGMTSEVVLYHSTYCFGTCDSIGFDGETLRVFDLKTGESPGHISQLLIYAALFCLQYEIDPDKIQFDLRLYHGTEIASANPEPAAVKKIMVRIVESVLVLTREDAV